MTIQKLIDWLSVNQFTVLLFYGVILLITILAVSIVTDKNFRKLRYIMSGLVYAVTVPGILAVILMFYSLLIIRTSLLDVPIVAYFVPIVIMILCLVFINRRIPMEKIPGFDKLSALMLLIAITFVIVFILQKMFFGVLFIGSFTQLLIVFTVILIILKITWTRLKKRK